MSTAAANAENVANVPTKADDAKTKETNPTPTPAAHNIAQVTDALFEDGCMIFSFGYIDSSMSRGLTVPPGGEPCVPMPKKWAIDEPLQGLLTSKPGLAPMFNQPFFATSFKLYCDAQPCAYFFDGKEQPEQEFSRTIAKGATVRDFLDALYDIFADAKVHPQEPMMIFALKMVDGDVHIDYGR